MQNPSAHLAKTLKDHRTQNGLSLDQAAKRTGVSKAMLGQIEREESSPTVATLWKISTGLGVSLSTFIEPIPKDNTATRVRTAADIRQHPADGGMLIAPLFPYEAHLGFEYMELTFTPAYERLSTPHQNGVIEIITVISGKVEIFADNSWTPLNSGQSIRFSGCKPHGYRNTTDQDAKVICLIHYPNHT